MMTFLRKRLREPSTWRALIGFLAMLGVSLSPEQSEAIVAAGIALYLAFEALLPDTGNDFRDDSSGGDGGKLLDPYLHATTEAGEPKRSDRSNRGPFNESD